MLNYDLLYAITLHLSWKDLNSFLNTCKEFHKIGADGYIARQRAIKQWPGQEKRILRCPDIKQEIMKYHTVYFWVAKMYDLELCYNKRERYPEAYERRTDLRGAYLHNAEMSGISIGAVNLANADLTGVELDGANLTGANLTDANLAFANLTGANLTGANLTDANLAFANLTGANLTGANLTDVTGLND